MRKLLLLPIFSLIVALAACGGGSTDNQQALQESINNRLHPTSSYTQAGAPYREVSDCKKINDRVYDCQYKLRPTLPGAPPVERVKVKLNGSGCWSFTDQWHTTEQGCIGKTNGSSQSSPTGH